MTDRDQDLNNEIAGGQPETTMADALTTPKKKRRAKQPYEGWSAEDLVLCAETTCIQGFIGASDAKMAVWIANDVRKDEGLRRFRLGTQRPEPALRAAIKDFIAAKNPEATLRILLAGLAAQQAAFLRGGHNPERLPSALPLGGRYRAGAIELELAAYPDGAVVAFELATSRGETVRGWGFGAVSPEGRLHMTMRNARLFSHEYRCSIDIPELCNGTAVQRLPLHRISFGIELSGNPKTELREETKFVTSLRMAFVRQPENDDAA